MLSLLLLWSVWLALGCTGCAQCSGPANPPVANPHVQQVAPQPQPQPGTLVEVHSPIPDTENGLKEVPDVSTKVMPLYPVMDHPVSLTVPGFHDASLATPGFQSDAPQPVVIVLHGNFDRPEWQCEMWQKVASFYGWVLCPRGVRTKAATLEEDRWTYTGGAAAVQREIQGGLEALEARYPGAVRRDGAVLVGFSLGANLLPEVLRLNPGGFSTVYIIEGGVPQLERALPGLQRLGVKRIGLAMSIPANRENGQRLLKKLQQKGFETDFVDMRGAGHNYRWDFSETGHISFRKLMEPE